jgi:AP-2 complex subunit beta-1
MLVATPLDSTDAELLAERIVPRLQHANSAVVLTAIKVILFFINFISKPDVVANLYKKLGPPLGKEFIHPSIGARIIVLLQLLFLFNFGI